jgi:hypothetical protein
MRIIVAVLLLSLSVVAIAKKKGTCAEYGCSFEFKPGQECQCFSQCTHEQTCCKGKLPLLSRSVEIYSADHARAPPFQTMPRCVLRQVHRHHHLQCHPGNPGICSGEAPSTVLARRVTPSTTSHRWWWARLCTSSLQSRVGRSTPSIQRRERRSGLRLSRTQQLQLHLRLATARSSMHQRCSLSY